MTSRVQQEIEHLARIAEDAQREPADRAKALLIVHQRRDVGECLCGWDELGKSHAGHVVDQLARAGLLRIGTHQETR